MIGKVKTIVQVVAVLALIAATDHHAAWVQALVYAMVVVTVVSGADYFLNFSRNLEQAAQSRDGAAAHHDRLAAREQPARPAAHR